MLKNYGYDGAYHDENLSVSVLLENPTKHGLDMTELAFSVMARGKSGETPQLDDFAFYIMDEANHLYNTRRALYSKAAIEIAPDDDEPVRRPDGLIHTDFKHDFLFQDLRIAFYYRPYQRIIIIGLEH
jgi:hypothetical protein